MIGTTLSHYKILEQIGEGGMGAVYAAEDLNLGRKVALKMLREEMASDPDRLERFRREAQAVAALSHPNIVTIFSIEEAPEGHFMTMELVDGKGLDEVITGDGMSAERMLEISEPLIRALVAAHERGITHRDLKPANIMVCQEGTVKILDFGLAKLSAAADSDIHEDMPTQALTQIGTVVGTIPYMSPEQVQGKVVDHRTDLFSLGVVLFEMATGHRPFDGETSVDVASAILRGAPESIHETRPDMPDQFGRIISRCLEKEPEMRYQTAGDILIALSKVGEKVASKGDDGQPSVAVLPFVNMSPDKDQEYFCEGLAEDIINALVGIEELKVASRTSAFRFKGSQSDIREVGSATRSLDGARGQRAQGWQSGSHRRAAGQRRRRLPSLVQPLRPRAQRRLRDPGRDSAEDRRGPAGHPDAQWQGRRPKRREKEAPEDVQAYDYYLKGRKYFYEFRAKGFELARQMFARAIAIDNNYARAYAGLADCCSRSLHRTSTPAKRTCERRNSSSRKAVELDPESAEAHCGRGLRIVLESAIRRVGRGVRKGHRAQSEALRGPLLLRPCPVLPGSARRGGRAYEEAAKVSPDDYQALQFLSIDLHQAGPNEPMQPRSLRRSVEKAKKHIAFHPDDVRALYLGPRTR